MTGKTKNIKYLTNNRLIFWVITTVLSNDIYTGRSDDH